MTSSLVRRFAVAAIGIPAAVGLVYAGGWTLAVTLSLLGLVGTWELYRLAQRGAVRPLMVLGCAGAGGVPLAVWAALPAGLGVDPVWVVLGGAAWLIAVMSGATGARAPDQRPLAAVSVTVFGAVYAAGLPAVLLLLRHPTGGELSPWAATGLVFLPLVTTWGCDTMAMLGGSVLGGRRLAPVLSPKKTWSGAIVGAGSALVLALGYGRVVLGAAGIVVETGTLLAVGLIVGVIGQAGDVAESLFKREAGVKDSGGFFPGHGGVLDRLDSLYWGIPGAALALKLGGVI